MRLLLHACCGPCSLEPSRILREQGHEISIFYANSNIAPASEYARRLETLRAWAGLESIAVEEGVYDPAAWQATAGRIGNAALREARKRLVAQRDGEAERRDETSPGAVVNPSSVGSANAGRDEDAGHASSADRPSGRGFGKFGALSLDEAASLAVDPEKRAARCRACYRLRLEEAARTAAQQGFEALGTTLAVSPYQYSDIIREELERAAAQTGLTPVFEDFRPFYPAATRRSRELGMYRQNYCGCTISNLEASAERAERKAERKAQHAAEQAARAEERAAEEAKRQARKAERAAYDAKQAKKHAILKALRQQQKQEEHA